jgi:triacylglycerol lipase
VQPSPDAGRWSGRDAMLVSLTANAWIEFLQQLSALLRDPVYYSSGVARGNGEPILLIPGFTAGDWTLGVMARWLKRIGYRPYLSGIDLNIGCPKRKIELVGWRVEKIANESGMRVALIGHSLGGVLARGVAAASPKRVSRVVALGAPVREGWDGVRTEVRPALRAVQSFWQTLASAPEDCGTPVCPCGFARAVYAEVAAAVRFDSIYTRRDEIVSWRACIAEDGPNHEVNGLHSSLIVNREVFRVLAEILAEDLESAAA